MNIIYTSREGKIFLGFDGRNYVSGKINTDTDGRQILIGVGYFTYIHLAIIHMANHLSGREATSLAKYAETLTTLWNEITKSTKSEWKSFPTGKELGKTKGVSLDEEEDD